VKAWQRQIREKRANEALDADMFGNWWDEIDLSLKNSIIEEISFDQAKNIIEKYEWLGTMGTTEISYGLICGGAIVGVACFGRTAGTNASSSVFGQDRDVGVMTLCRGACVHFAHEHSASHLISAACQNIADKGIAKALLAYSDPEAGEIGTVYQACNWIYTGMTSPTEKFRTPAGDVKDARLVSAYTRDRRGGVMKYKRSRAEQKIIMINSGHTFFKGHSKHRYIGVYGGTPSEKRGLLKKVKYGSHPYPKRIRVQEGTSGDQPEGLGQFQQSAPN